MIQWKSESGSATVVGFVLIFALIVSFAVLYFAVVLPASSAYNEEIEVISLKEDVITLSHLLEKMKQVPQTPVSYMPVFKRSGSVELASGGSFVVYGQDWSTHPLQKLFFSSGDSLVGLFAGGIFRMDSDNSVWLLRPQVFVSDTVVSFVLPKYSGTYSRGVSTGGIALSLEYCKTSIWMTNSNSPTQVTYSGSDVKLWHAAFSELASLYPAYFDSTDPKGKTTSLTFKPRDNLTIEIIRPEYLIS